MAQKKTRIGMTIDEREDLIVFLTRMFPDLPFECRAFPDGSVGLDAESTVGEWITVKRPEDYLGFYASEEYFNDRYGAIFERDGSIYQRVARIMRWRAEYAEEYHPIPALCRAIEEAVKYAESRNCHDATQVQP